MYVVYKHTCLANGKAYVGYTSLSVKERWEQHVAAALRNSTSVFHAAIRKYGVDLWEHETLAECDSIETAKSLEQHFIAEHWTFVNHIFVWGYNMTPGGDGRQVGSYVSDETRKKISVANTGKTQSTTTREKRSKSLKGRVFSEITLRKFSKRVGEKNAFFGKKQTLKHAEAIKTKLGKPVQQFKNGVLICEYDTVSDAKRATNILHIGDVCNGIRTQAGGFVWKFKINA